MRVIGTKNPISGDALYSEIDLFSDISVPDSKKKSISREVGEFITDKIKEYVAKQTSPVGGLGRYKDLSTEYKKYKRSTGARGIPNLELFGNMLDALSYKTTEDGVNVGIFNRKQALKGDGHNNFSGESQIPTRKFLPEENETFKRQIITGVNEILAKSQIDAGAIDETYLGEITTKVELQTYLKELFQGMTLTQVRRAILANPELLAKFEALGLLQWL